MQCLARSRPGSDGLVVTRVTTAVIVLALTVALIAMAVPVAGDDDPDDPEVPASYYGTLEVDGELAEPGVVVEAAVDGVVNDSITVGEDGSFGGPTAEDEKLTVEGNEGDVVTFYAEGEDLPRTQADQTVELEAFDDQELSLTVTDADEGTNGETGDGTGDGSDESYPVANITVHPESPALGETVSLSGDNSSVPEGTITEFEWSIDGEQISHNKTLTTSFNETGEHEVTLLVRSDTGLQDSVSTTVTVEDETQPDDVEDGEPADATDQGDDDDLPGFGPIVVGAALAIALYRLRN